MDNANLVRETKPASKPSKLIFDASVITIIVAAALVVFAVVGLLRDNDQNQALEDQAARTTDLIEQVKTLAEQNQNTTEQTANYAYCNAVLLAQYTRTLMPIDIQDLNDCALESYPRGTVSPREESAQPAVSVSTQQTPETNASAPSSNISLPLAQPATPPKPIAPPIDNSVYPEPIRRSQTPSTTPTGILPGTALSLPCVDALGLISIGCR